MNFPRGGVLKLSLNALLCFLSLHKYRNLPYKKLFWNDDLNVDDVLACAIISHRCIHCDHESNASVRVFKLSQMKHLSPKNQKIVITRAFEQIEAYENRSL